MCCWRRRTVQHIGTLSYYINNEEILSKTDLPQTWGKPSKVGEEKYKKGKMICDLFHTKKPRLIPDIQLINIKSIIENSNLLELPCSLSFNLKAELKSEINRTCEDTLNFLINSVEDELIYDLNNPLLNIIIFEQLQLNNIFFTDNKFLFLLSS